MLIGNVYLNVYQHIKGAKPLIGAIQKQVWGHSADYATDYSNSEYVDQVPIKYKFHQMPFYAESLQTVTFSAL